MKRKENPTQIERIFFLSELKYPKFRIPVVNNPNDKNQTKENLLLILSINMLSYNY